MYIPLNPTFPCLKWELGFPTLFIMLTCKCDYNIQYFCLVALYPQYIQQDIIECCLHGHSSIMIFIYLLIIVIIIISFFQNNLKNYPAVNWQYFADDAGHYVQYPTNDRICDKATGNITSPLVQ